MKTYTMGRFDPRVSTVTPKGCIPGELVHWVSCLRAARVIIDPTIR